MARAGNRQYALRVRIREVRGYRFRVHRYNIQIRYISFGVKCTIIQSLIKSFIIFGKLSCFGTDFPVFYFRLKAERR